MNEQEKTTMNIIEPEGLSNCGADSSTWCGQALTRVLIGMTLTGLTLNVLCLNYILPAIGMVFLLVGLRALRRETQASRAAMSSPSSARSTLPCG